MVLIQYQEDETLASDTNTPVIEEFLIRGILTQGGREGGDTDNLYPTGKSLIKCYINNKYILHIYVCYKAIQVASFNNINIVQTFN